MTDPVLTRQVFDRIHGISQGHHNFSKSACVSMAYILVNVIFAAATVFLLKYRDNANNDSGDDMTVANFDSCVSLHTRAC